MSRSVYDELLRYVVPGGRPAPKPVGSPASVRGESAPDDGTVPFLADVLLHAEKNAGTAVPWSMLLALPYADVAEIIAGAKTKKNAIRAARRWLNKQKKAA